MLHTRRFPLAARERHTMRAAWRLAIVSGLATSCAEVTAPPVDPMTPSAIIIIGGKLVGVLNTNLRFVGNPDTSPGTRAHIQLKVFSTDEGGLVINWMGEFVEGTCDVFLGGGIYGIQDSEDFPNPETEAAIDLLRGEERACSNNLLEGVSAISPELAGRLLTNPENFIAVFFGDPGGPIAGPLRVAPAAM